ncbi:sulfatase [Flavivirga sp. Y03]|uniref:Sulfatase n=2 Tax=Flavivirga algicola TaxID=2729136 RepID=A0ABX1S1U6_9FLAO|nr:sulfatase [Flavivirga algicola]
MVDDLRPELNCFGKTQIVSPNIDALAKDGVIFSNAYCNVPVCGASRASILTGLYPTKKRFTNYGSRVDKDAPKITTLPEHFKNNGYLTLAIGKIFHHPDDALQSWSKTPYRPDYPNSIKQQELWRDYQSLENSWTKKEKLPLGAAGPAWEAADVPDSVYYDGKTTKLALEALEKLSKSEQPFFLGIGFIRPHLPFNSPRKYWDLYNEDEITLAKNPHMPFNSPKFAWFNYRELRGYTNIAKDTLPIKAEQAKKLRHGYYASVSFIDAQIGRVIKKLKKLNLYENTTIVVLGDHGWSLGEHSLWCKHSCFNNALRTPLIVKTPKSQKGIKTESLISFVDIYPTLCELNNIEKPLHIDGKSFEETLINPNIEINDYVFSRWGRGETIKSHKFSYTQYFDREGNLKSHMLYNHEIDHEENINIADRTENREQLEELSKALNRHLLSRE